MHVAGVFQEARDADSRTCTRSQVLVECISFLTFPHPLHCLICANDITIIGLLLQVMWDGKFQGWFIQVRV